MAQRWVSFCTSCRLLSLAGTAVRLICRPIRLDPAYRPCDELEISRWTTEGHLTLSQRLPAGVQCVQAEDEALALTDGNLYIVYKSLSRNEIAGAVAFVGGLGQDPVTTGGLNMYVLLL